MCTCTKNRSKSKLIVKHGWRVNALFRIEKLIREVGQENRAKRMGICGNSINVKVKKGKYTNVLFEPQLRCKDRVCPVCNSYRASILSRKVEKLGENMSNPHLLTITASTENRDNLKIAFAQYKESIRRFKRNKTWFGKYVKGGVEHIEVVKNKKTGWHIHSHILIDLDVDRKVENMRMGSEYMEVDPIKKELELVLDQVGLGTISDIRPVVEGYGREISKYSMKFDLDIAADDLKSIIVDLKGKRMVSRFGNCYGVKDDDLEELTEEEQNEYEDLGTLEKVVSACFNDGETLQGGINYVDTELFLYVKEAISIGLIVIDFKRNYRRLL